MNKLSSYLSSIFMESVWRSEMHEVFEGLSWYNCMYSDYMSTTCDITLLSFSFIFLREFFKAMLFAWLGMWKSFISSEFSIVDMFWMWNRYLFFFLRKVSRFIYCAKIAYIRVLTAVSCKIEVVWNEMFARLFILILSFFCCFRSFSWQMSCSMYGEIALKSTRTLTA